MSANLNYGKSSRLPKVPRYVTVQSAKYKPLKILLQTIITNINKAFSWTVSNSSFIDKFG